MAISFPPIPTIANIVKATTRPTNPLAQPPATPDPQDTFTPSGAPEFPAFPKPGTFGPVAGPSAAPPTPQKLPSMAELDQQAADCIDQGTQMLLALQPVLQTPSGFGLAPNFSAQDQEQKMAILDMKAAQAIQRQTQLALRDKKAPDNKLTQAAVERRRAALKEKLGEGKIGCGGVLTNFSSQAFDQQKAIIGEAQKQGWPAPTTQPTQPPSPFSRG